MDQEIILWPTAKTAGHQSTQGILTCISLALARFAVIYVYYV